MRRPREWGFRVYAKIGTGPGIFVILRGKRKPPSVGEKIHFQRALDADLMGRHAAANNWTVGIVDEVRLGLDGEPWLYLIRLA